MNNQLTPSLQLSTSLRMLGGLNVCTVNQLVL